MSSAADQIKALEEKRAARRARISEAEEAQYAIDLVAIDALEEQYGENRLHVLRLDHVPGLPVRVVMRCPEANEMKKFRATLRDRGQPGTKVFKAGDPVQAAEDLAVLCLVYPDRETFSAMCAAFPSLLLQCGNKASDLSTAHEEAEGKG